jgi:hypothetical protein
MGKRISFFFPELPADVAGEILGVKVEFFEHKLRGIEDLDTDPVAREPSDFVFSHIIYLLNTRGVAIISAVSDETREREKG